MRISVTDIDAWRYYKTTEEMDADALMLRLRHLEPPTQPMLAGKALHRFLEKAGPGEMETAEAEGFKFRFQGDCSIPSLPVRELKGEMLVSTTLGPVTLVGIIDGLDGAIYDWKLTERFDAERYADSYQWRAYLTMFGGRKFVYGVFEGREDLEAGEWVIRDFQQFPLYAYEGMASDVLREVCQLAEFIDQHLPERRAA